MNISTGILLKIASVLVFTLMAAVIKLTADAAPPGQQVFFRSFFAIPVILIWLASRGMLREGLRTKRPINHFYRGFVGTTSMAFNFGALGLLPFPEATALGYAFPLLTVIFAAMFLGEEVRAFRLIAVITGFLGVIIVLLPNFGITAEGLTQAQTLGAVFALCGAAAGALAQIFVRKMVAEESISVIVFWFSVTAAIMSLATIPFGWTMPSPANFALLVLSGLLGGLGQILLTSSYWHAPASVVAPFEYVSIFLALAIGYFSFGEVPTWTMLIGVSIVIAAGVAIILRERQLGIERNRSKRATTP